MPRHTQSTSGGSWATVGRARLHLQRRSLTAPAYDVLAAPPTLPRSTLPQPRTTGCRAPILGEPRVAALWSGEFRSLDQRGLRASTEANVVRPLGVVVHFFNLGVVTSSCSAAACPRSHAGRQRQAAGSVSDAQVVESINSFCHVAELFYGEPPGPGEPGARTPCPGTSASWPQYLRTQAVFRSAQLYEEAQQPDGRRFGWFVRLRPDALILAPLPPLSAMPAHGATVPISSTTHLSDHLAVVAREAAPAYFGYADALECSTPEALRKWPGRGPAPDDGRAFFLGRKITRANTWDRLYEYMTRRNVTVHEAPIGFVLLRPDGPDCAALSPHVSSAGLGLPGLTAANRLWENRALAARVSTVEAVLAWLVTCCRNLSALWLSLDEAVGGLALPTLPALARANLAAQRRGNVPCRLMPATGTRAERVLY